MLETMACKVCVLLAVFCTWCTMASPCTKAFDPLVEGETATKPVHDCLCDEPAYLCWLNTQIVFEEE
jgi:hypothetical protein